MARILLSEVFTLEHVAEMTAAMSTRDLDTSAIGAGNPLYRDGESIIKSWPTTTGIKFGLGRKKWGIALTANENSILKKIIVLASERRLGSFLNNHSFLV